MALSIIVLSLLPIDEIFKVFCYPSDNEEEVEQKVKDIMVADFARLLVSPIQPCILSLEIAIHLPKYHPDTETPPPNN